MQYGGSAYGHQGGHPYNDRSCLEFAATGRCKYGNSCKFSHDMRPPADFPGRPTHGPQQAALFKTKICPLFMRSGDCRYGADCKFAHGQHELHDFQGFEALSQPPQQQQQQQQHYGSAGHYGSSPADYQGGSNAGSQQQYQQQQQQQHRQQAAAGAQQQQQQQQQQQPPPPPIPGLSKPFPGKVTYVDQLRAICTALSIGAAKELVTDESLQKAVQAFQRGTAFKENKFADGVEAYLPIA
ncbi:hypothetical protein OEZ85_009651 [Tetradesmus obliquus]|uniref:C3H1-type domain-containing protein n=1 Tax=Tetradesmus obliquus TaxID=3088 RepID=A0ABY8UA75_TETOB|nr:hypothetical protein OEZ85_009651 [Tetradesmus obliquus]